MSTTSRITYEWAVMDGNMPPDGAETPVSCHHTYEAAAKAARAGNRRDVNGHDYVVEWDAPRWAKLQPNDAHYPCQRWLREESEGN